MTISTYVQVACLRGSLAGRVFAFIDPAPIPLPQPLLLGRSPDCHICFQGAADTMISRRHMEVQLDADGIRLIDASTHGTFLLQTKERISSLYIPRGAQAVIQLGPGGPICRVAAGVAFPFGNYALVAKLGEGGMAAVFVAADNRLDRFVVLKLLRPELRKLDALAEQRLLTEARIVAQLEHNNVVRVYELGELGGVPFIAMEYLRGISLGQLIAKLTQGGKRLAPPLAAAIMAQVCLGLHAAHELPARVVHRDVSPNNILITRDSVKVIDFGIARTNMPGPSKPVTAPNITAGCPPYMSPEQVAAPQSVSRLSDIFSAAAVLYELCAGASAFSRGNMVATMAAVLTHELLPLRSVCEQASESLERLLQRALSKHPAERQPATAAEFAALLKAEAGPQLQSHDSIISAMEELGIDFQSLPPTPLSEEPELVRRSRPAPARAQSAPEGSEPLAARRSLPRAGSPGAQSALGGRVQPDRPERGAAVPAAESFADLTADAQEEGGEGLSRSAWIKDGRPAAPPVADPLQQALAQLEGGWLQLDAPREMNVGRAYVIRAGAARSLLQRSLAESGAEHRAVSAPDSDFADAEQSDPLHLGRLLRLELYPDDAAAFTVRRLSPEEQSMLRSDLSQWDWLVIPHRPGDGQGLHLTATHFVEARGQRVSKRTPLRSLRLRVHAATAGAGIVGLPTTVLRGLLEQLLPSESEFERFYFAHIPESHRRPSPAMDRMLKVGLLLFLGNGARITDSLRRQDPQAVAQAEAQALTTLETNLDPAASDSMLPVVLPARGGELELRSARIARIFVASHDLNPREHRTPIALPLDLEGLVADFRRPLVATLVNRMVELRVASETLKAGRTFRIYPSDLTTNGGRNSYTLPLPCPGKPLYVGHHRGEHRTITVASNLADPQEGEPPRLELSALGLRLISAAGTDRLFAVYSIEPDLSCAYVACFTVRR